MHFFLSPLVIFPLFKNGLTPPTSWRSHHSSSSSASNWLGVRNGQTQDLSDSTPSQSAHLRLKWFCWTISVLYLRRMVLSSMMVLLREVGHLLAICWPFSELFLTCSSLEAWHSFQWWSCPVGWDWPPVGHFLNYSTVFQPVQLQEHDTFSNDGVAVWGWPSVGHFLNYL